MLRCFRFCVWVLLLVTSAGFGMAAEWQPGLYLDGGGWWRSRMRVQVHNDKPLAVAGEPVTIRVGNAAGQAALVGQLAQALRVCDAAGQEMLFALHAPDGGSLVTAAIPEGSTLLIPVECRANTTADYFVYFDNPAALALPDFLSVRTQLVNGDLELGQGDAPAGWVHDAPDAEHRASWSTEPPRSGKRCLKTVVADGAPATWISTRQRALRVVGGAKYRMQAWVKAENVRGQTGWYIHLGNREKPLITSPMLLAGEGTFDWKQVTAEFTAPAEADLADLGTVLHGSGTAWFDNVTLACLTPGALSAEVLPAESLQLRDVGADAVWPKEGISPASSWHHRAAVDVLHLGDEELGPTQVVVDLWRLQARLRGRLNAASLSVRWDGQPVPHHFIGDQLLFPARMPPRTRRCYYIYFSDQPSQANAVKETPRPGGETPATARAATGAETNLVQNPNFESGVALPDDWTATEPAHGPQGVTFGFDAPDRDGLGQRCLKLHVPADAPKTWRGWRQDVPVKPGKTYLLAAWVKCQEVRGGEVRIHAHRRTADGQMSAHEPYASIGPGISGTTDWTLLSGTLSMPADTTSLQVHLTMEHSGSLWHAAVLLTEVVSGRIGRLEGRPGVALQSLTVWQVPAVVKVFPDDPAPPTAPPVELAAARNEKEPLQLAVRSRQPLSQIQVDLQPLLGPNGFALDDVTVNVVGYVPIDYPTNYYESHSPAWHRKVPTARASCDGWPGMWPDPLLPTRAFDLPADATQPIWITLGIPRQAPAGRYSGTVRLLRDGKSLIELPLALHVWDFTLPDESHLAAIFDVRFGPDAGVWGKSLSEMYPDIIRFMAARRLCPDGVSPSPVFRRENGRLTADFTAYDKAAQVYFDELKFPHAYTPWDLYAFGWGHPPKPVFGEEPYAGHPPFESVDRSQLRPEYKRAYQEVLRCFWKHVKDKGWDQRIVLYVSDEPFDHEEHIRTQMKAVCEMVHEVDRSIPIYASTWKHVPEWDGSLDVWGIGHDGRVPTEQMAKLRAAGDRLRFTTDGQLCTDTPYCAVERLLPHYCFQYGVEAYEFWGITWQTYNPFRFGWHRYIHQESEPGKSSWIRYPNGDGFLLYPGAPLGYSGVVSSIRCEQAREGVEDYEYLVLLRQRIAQAKAAGKDVAAAEQALSLAADLVPIPNAGGRFSTKILPDPERLYDVRKQIAVAIESLRP